MDRNLMDLYFIRHAEPDYSESDNYKRDLSTNGFVQASGLLYLFKNINIDGVYSSPYLRAINTVKPLAEERKKPIRLIDELKERKSAHYRVPDNKFAGFAQKQWNDYSFKFRGGESLRDVRDRYNTALRKIIDFASNNGEKTLIIGCHITGLCSYLSQYGIVQTYQDFDKVRSLKPWIVHLSYDKDSLTPVIVNGSFHVLEVF